MDYPSMYLKKKVITALIALLIIVIATGVYFTAQSLELISDNTDDSPIIIMDDLGRNVSIGNKIERIISIVPSNTEIIFAIGGENKLIGVDQYSVNPPRIESMIEDGEIQVVGSAFSPDIEKIVALQPDLIIANGPSMRTALVRLEELNLPIIYLRPIGLDGLYNNIQVIGESISLGGASEELVQSIQKRVSAVQNAVKDKPRVRVYMETWSDPMLAVGPNTLPDEVISLAGGINVFSDAVGQVSVAINPEAVVARNPDVIIIAGNEVSLTEVSSRPGFHTIDAVENNRIYYISRMLIAPSPRIAEGLEKIAMFLHPDAS